GRAAGGDGRAPPEYGDLSGRCGRAPALRSVAAVRAVPGQHASSVARAPQLIAASGLEQTIDAADPKNVVSGALAHRSGNRRGNPDLQPRRSFDRSVSDAATAPSL